MSFILRRLLSGITKRTFSKTPVKRESEMPDPVELATGLQRREIEAYLEGRCDPFHNDVLKRGPGTKDKPTLIPSAFTGRIVGCICKDHRFVCYMWLEKDCPKRCECGHWYKLKQVKPL